MKETRLFEEGDITVRFRKGTDILPKAKTIQWSVDLLVGGVSVWSGYCTEVDVTATSAAGLVTAQKAAIDRQRQQATAKIQMRLVGVGGDWLAPNNKISAINAIRDKTGLGLREAKDFVDQAIAGTVKGDVALMKKLNDGLRSWGHGARFVAAE